MRNRSPRYSRRYQASTKFVVLDHKTNLWIEVFADINIDPSSLSKMVATAYNNRSKRAVDGPMQVVISNPPL